MSDDSGAHPNLRVIFPETKRKKRRRLPALIRYAIVATVGAFIALAAFYILRKMGF